MSEVRAAAERLMELKKLPIEKQKDFVRAWPELGWDGIMVARAWLAANPADDELPVDEAWLRSIGARRGGSPHARPLFIDCVNFDDVANGVVSICDWTETAIVNHRYTTRGSVRRLLAALGISKEQSQ